MPLNTYFSLAILALATTLDAASTCDVGYVICSPPGATSSTTPQIGSSDFEKLYVDIVESSLPSSKRSLPIFSRASTSLCCNAQLSCLTISSLALPFCYDRFTTNFLLPDGSTGTVVGGSYKSAGGDVANLLTGDYTLANGQKGNIYSADAAAKPNTATLPIPSQFTASGVGSAIPIASLGSEIILTYTTTLPGSTIVGSTVPPTTLPGTISTETLVFSTTTTVSAASGPRISTGTAVSYSTISLPPTTVPGTTISGATVAAVVTTITTSEFSAFPAPSTPSPTTTTKKNSGSRIHIDGLGVLIIGLFGLWFA